MRLSHAPGEPDGWEVRPRGIKGATGECRQCCPLQAMRVVDPWWQLLRSLLLSNVTLPYSRSAAHSTLSEIRMSRLSGLGLRCSCSGLSAESMRGKPLRSGSASWLSAIRGDRLQLLRQGHRALRVLPQAGVRRPVRSRCRGTVTPGVTRGPVEARRRRQTLRIVTRARAGS